MDWFEQNAWAAWLGLALALGAVEAATVDFIFIMLAGGALAGAGAAAFGAAFPVQVVTAAVVAVALLALVRPEVKKRMLGSAGQARLGMASYVGRAAEVTAAVTTDGGRVRIGGEEWSARVADGHLPLSAGTRARVVSIEGATAVVAPDAPPQDSTLGE